MVDVIAQHSLEVFAIMGVILAFSIAVDFWGHKDGHEMGIKEATGWFTFFVLTAIAFYFYIDVRFGSEWASLYMSGYALEKALAVDNMVVFIAIFASFGIKSSALKHKILMWGIAGALVFRGIFVAAGTALFNLHWSVQVIFGIIVAASAYAIIKGGDDDEEVDYSKHWAVKFVSKFAKVTPEMNGDKFTKVIDGITHLTPAFLCVLVIELSDIMFSFDSVPAVIGVTQEPILVYAAMMFAVLGLRSLFFILEAAMKYLVHLDKAVAAVLVFVGIKLCFGAFGMHMNPNTSLYIILGTLVIGMIASVIFREKQELK